MKKTKISTCIFLVIVLTLGIFAGIGVVSAPVDPEFVPGEVIIGLKDINAAAREAIKARGGAILKEISAVNALVVKVSAGSEKAFIRNVQSIPGLKYAERNGVVKAVGTISDSLKPQYTPSDPDYGLQWNMPIISADDAWDIHMGSTSVVVAIVDTGVDYTHNDLAAHYLPGGYDWVNMDPDPWDDHYHGTHCAGIAAAEMDNGYGVTGVAQVSIWSEKVLNQFGSGDWGDLADGIIHASDAGVDVISMSLGGTYYSSLVDDACTYAYSNGVLLVAASGNYGYNLDSIPFYPASLSTVMAVGATDSSDVRPWWSDYGSVLEVSAPGVSVYSTMPGNSYGYLDGTSMACPHVAGVAALTWSYDPELTNVQMRERLHQAVDDLGDPGWDPYYGHGRINAYKALTAAPEFDYHIIMDPYINVLHFNIDPAGWIYGYMTGGPQDWNPLLGRAVSGTLVIGVDVYPDEEPGYYETLFLYAKGSTMSGEFIQTEDGMTFAGPWLFTIVPTAVETLELEGQDLTAVSGEEVYTQAWYKLGFNEFTDIVNLEVHTGLPWINGYDEIYTPYAPILGITGGGKLFYCIDFIGGGYELAFLDNTISTMDGELIRTYDGTDFVGPTYVSFYPLP
jgi:subtilisin family serine protease